MLNNDKAQINYVLVGPPGSGKGTLATKLSEHTKLPVLTVSTVLKKAMQTDLKLEAEVKALMDEGRFVSDEVISRVLLKEVQDPVYSQGVIFDGFPRTLAQTEFFIQNNLVIDVMVVLDISDDIIVERMTGRRVHLPSGRMYHIDNAPPKVAMQDDITGEPLLQRDDDHPEIVTRRLADYHTLTSPIIDWAIAQLNQQGIVHKIISVDASQPIDQVWHQVLNEVS